MERQVGHRLMGKKHSRLCTAVGGRTIRLDPRGTELHMISWPQLWFLGCQLGDRSQARPSALCLLHPPPRGEGEGRAK